MSVGVHDAKSRKQATYQSVWRAKVRRAVRRKLQPDEHTPVRNEHRQNEESAKASDKMLKEIDGSVTE